MPRKGRGGRRQGTPGQTYSNRTDLNTDPVKTTPTYATNNSQRQQATNPQPANIQPPGSQPFARPSERPSEPLTAGLSTGDGPDSSILNLPSTADPDALDLQALTPYLPALEKMAGLPTASNAFVIWVKRIRGASDVSGQVL